MTDTDPFAYAKAFIRTNGDIRQIDDPAPIVARSVVPGTHPNWVTPAYWAGIRTRIANMDRWKSTQAD